MYLAHRSLFRQARPIQLDCYAHALFANGLHRGVDHRLVEQMLWSQVRSHDMIKSATAHASDRRRARHSYRGQLQRQNIVHCKTTCCHIAVRPSCLVHTECCVTLRIHSNTPTLNSTRMYLRNNKRQYWASRAAQKTHDVVRMYAGFTFK